MLDFYINFGPSLRIGLAYAGDAQAEWEEIVLAGIASSKWEDLFKSACQITQMSTPDTLPVINKIQNNRQADGVRGHDEAGQCPKDPCDVIKLPICPRTVCQNQPIPCGN